MDNVMLQHYELYTLYQETDFDKIKNIKCDLHEEGPTGTQKNQNSE